MTPQRFASSLCALVCLATSAIAQQYTVKKIVFNGTTPYSQASLEAAAGLKAGGTIAKADLQAAAQRLVDTGAFEDLQSTLDGPVKGITVIFKVKAVDPSRVLTASFDNFVWFQPDELQTALHKLVPLFNGTVPEAGNQEDAVVAALKQLLKGKGIAADVTFEPVAPSASQPLRLAEFRVAKPEVHIHSVSVSGGVPQFSATTDKLTHALVGRNYNEGLIPGSITNLLPAGYRDAGYQASSITDLTRSVAASTDTRVDVEVTATISAGDVYRVSQLEWQGSPMMSADGFAVQAKLHPGDVASRKALLESLGMIESAYRNKGYMDVAVTAAPQLDASARTVVFKIAANPGEQYKVRQVTPIGLSAAQQQDFDKAWKLHPGEVFDEGYASSFLKSNSAIKSFEGYSAKFKTVADPDTHLVDLTMTFVKDGSLAR